MMKVTTFFSFCYELGSLGVEFGDYTALLLGVWKIDHD